MSTKILIGDCRETLKSLPNQSVHCVITSPPYWGLRSYKGDTGMIGLEATWDEHLNNLMQVFNEVWRVLRDDGTLWLNYGDAYATAGIKDTKPKNLMMMPSKLAIAMQEYGWTLRSEIIWAKPNPMPESAKDRPTTAHEKIYLFTKKPRYYYDHVAVRKKAKTNKWPGIGKQHATERDRNESQEDMQVNPTSNLKNVWYIPTNPFKGAHFATFPVRIVEPCIMAGTSEHGVCAANGSPYERLTKEKKEIIEYKNKSVQMAKENKNRYPICSSRKGRPKSFTPDTVGWNPTCGAPYKRDIEYSGGTIGKSWHDHKDDLGKGQIAPHSVGDYNIKTKGWQPTCECKGNIKPAVVLDPFGGSGTVSIVAERLGRDSIICEISPEYAEIARKRIEGESLPMFPTKIEVI